MRRLLEECGGSAAWAAAVADRARGVGRDALPELADAAWASLEDAAMRAAFDMHPASVPEGGDEATRRAAEVALRLYRERFGHAFVSATPSHAADELLMRVRIRLGNDPLTEWRTACDEQRRFARQRLEDRLAAGADA
ncbi:MAG: 2-oxo-4-hydroxy-4-carboxy-5-ureidoimidazoline decarboxylase [Gemmatimonadota bacterium]